MPGGQSANMSWETGLLIAIPGALAVAGGVSAWRFERLLRRARDAVSVAPPPVDVGNGLPDVMRDFAERNGAVRGDLARGAALAQDAAMQMKPGAPWQPIAARQRIATGAAGFCWEGRAAGAGPAKFRVLDAYAGGRGLLAVQLFGVLPAARSRGGALDRGEAMRYLAELPWAPDAILGNPGIRWSDAGKDGVAAALDLTDGPVEVRFGFDDAGDIVEVTARGRPARGPGGRQVLRDWQGHFAQYEWIGARRIPTRAEVGYLDETGRVDPYFQCVVTTYTAIH